MLLSTAYAQTDYTLEQIDMSPPKDTLGQIINYNTYVTDINNRGFLTGYFTNENGENVAFIITRKGVIYQFGFEELQSTDIKAVSINNKDIALLVSKESGKTTFWKIQVMDELVSAPQKVEGVEINTAEALKINDNNDISGWYTGQNTRWLFILHDSLTPPGTSKWQAARMVQGNQNLHTWGNGMDLNNNVAGFYLDGTNYYPFLYDGNSNTFSKLTVATKTKVWDMNNDQLMVGEYQQANGTYMAFYGSIQGDQLKLTSLAFIFHNDKYQSVANGVNDKGHIVGQFYDPNNKKWTGFIFRPGKDRYKYQGYDFKKHTWAFANDESDVPGNTDAHWNHDFFDNYVDYKSFDPYLYDGTPLYDNELRKIHGFREMSNYSSPDWKSYCIEADWNYTPNGTALDKKEYKHILKAELFNKWLMVMKNENDATKDGEFLGDCYGFCITSMLHYYDSTSLHQRYNLPVGGELSSYSNMDSVAKRAIVRGQILQDDEVLNDKYSSNGIWAWAGLYRTKTYMLDTLQKVNMRTMSIYMTDTDNNGNIDTSGHAVFPYEIHTPKKLPFTNPTTLNTEHDTLMIYDPNSPMVDRARLTVRSDRMYFEEFTSPVYNLIYAIFDRPTTTEIMSTQYAYLWYGPGKKPDEIPIASPIKKSTYNFSFSRRTDYIISANGLQCYELNDVYKNNLAKLEPEKGLGVNAKRPLFFRTDTSESYKIRLNNYRDSVMKIIQTTDDISMVISRQAINSEEDNLSVGKRTISYGNPDGISKSISCNYTQTGRRSNTKKSVNIIASGLTMASGDSIITLVPDDYTYRIIYPKEGNVRYDLDVYALYPEEIRHFSAKNLSLPSNTAHTINPYHKSGNGTSTVIYVDNGLDGISEDTTTIEDIPLSADDENLNVEWIDVYPNPASNLIKIRLGEQDAGNLKIFVVNTEKERYSIET